MITELGKALDPVADKLTLGCYDPMSGFPV